MFGSRIAAVLFVMLLSGCATQPVTQTGSRPVTETLPAYGALQAAAQPDFAVVMVTRDSGLMGAAGKAKLFVDGSPVAEFWASQRLTFSLPPGHHIFGVSPVPQVLNKLNETSSEITARQRYYYRISVGADGYQLEPTAIH